MLGAVLHEPALVVLFDDPAPPRGIVTAAVEEGMRLGGRRLALERFVRLVAGDANWNALNFKPRARMLSSADTYFEMVVSGMRSASSVLDVASHERIGVAPDQQRRCGDVPQLGGVVVAAGVGRTSPSTREPGP